MNSKKTKRHLMGKLTHLFPADYRKSDGIHVPKVPGERIDYNEGDAPEEYLSGVVKHATDKSLFSSEITQSIRDWSSLYHLSPNRANLLRPFSSALRARVLEVGAGCGALTRFLGEVGGDVVAIEGSYRRALIARERTKDLDNVAIVADRIQDFSSRALFDVVVAVGVLEYSRLYIKNAVQPEKTFLLHLGRLLKRDGVIILAIENKLGLKYFAGAAEDHTGVPFAGINDDYTSDSVVTFGQMELRELLNTTSFREQRWYFPCPDYKLPATILSPKVISEHHELAATLLAQSVVLDPQRPNNPSFSLEQAWSVIEQNRLVGQLANSFLVVAGMSRASVAEFDSDKSIAWHYTTGRHPAFNKQTQFVQQNKGIIVQRRHLQATPAPAVPLECVIKSERFVDGTNWWRRLSSIMNKANWSVREIADWGRVWIDALLQVCKINEFNGDTFREYVSGRFFDAAPFNLIQLTKGACCFVDQEWRLMPDVEFGFLVFRGLRDSLMRVTSSAAAAPNTPSNVNVLISTILAELGVMVTKIELDRFSLMEQQVQSWIQGRVAEDISEDLIAGFRNSSLHQRAPLDRASLIQERARVVAEGERKIAELGEQLSAISQKSEDLSRQRDALAAAHEEEKAAAAQANALAASLGQEIEGLRGAVRDHEDAAAMLHTQLREVQSASDRRQGEVERLSSHLVLAQSSLQDRDSEIRRLSRDLDATRLFLRDSQSEVQRLAGELDNAQAEMARADSERRSVSDAFAARSRELFLVRSRIERLQKKIEELRHREEAWDRAAREKDEAAAARIRDLEARLSEESDTKERLAEELARTTEQISIVEKNAAERAAAWEAVRAATLAESENKAQAQIRALRDQLVDAEAALARGRAERNNTAWKRRVWRWEKRRLARELMQSGLFDAAWYVREYPDVKENGRAPVEHYLEEGYLHGYRPNPFFDTRWYLQRYEDVRRAGINPLVHYLENGYREGRNPGPEFETDFYLLTYPDVRASGVNPLVHYLRYGKGEGRLPRKP
jgi:2-polyprenyl-3-methyl-5-hydroxy-6-metoxy-1,4-benzoquinol methylase